jgi:PAS domain S-box-containing protein
MGHRSDIPTEDLQYFFENSQDLLCILGFDGKIRYISPIWEDSLGYTLDQIREKPLKDFLHPDDRDLEFNDVTQKSRKRKLPSLDLRFRHKNGEYKWYSWISQTSLERNCVFGVAREITDRKEMEFALKMSEQRARNLIEAMPVGFYHYSLDEQDRLIFQGFNKQANEMFNLDHSKFIGKAIEEIFPGLMNTELPQKYREIAKNGGRMFFPSVPYKDEKINGEFEVFAFQTNPNAMAVFFFDISDRVRTQNALKESEANLRSIIRVAPIGIGLVKNRVLTQVNERICTMTGYDPEELLGHSARMLYPTQEDFDYVGKEKYRQIADKGTGTVETRWVRKDGKIIHVLLSSTPLDVSNLDLGVTFTALDITDRKEAEEKRLQIERKMLHAQKLESLGILAGGIAHDFNNLLMGILGNIDLAKMDLPQNSPVDGFLDNAYQAAQKAANLTRQLLAYSGKGKYVIEPVNLSRLIAEMLSLLKTSISKKINFNIQLNQDLPKILADSTQIQQLIMNLIVNASEAIGDQVGTITIATGVRKCDEDYLLRSKISKKAVPGDFVFMEIADTGCGMDQQTQERLFEPFFTTKFTGRGLGLSAVVGIVNGHNGAIMVYSEVGKGTTFKVLFPIAQAHTLEQYQQGNPKTAQPESPHFSGTILVVYDEETIRQIGKNMLSRMGFTVLLAEDGEQALQILKSNLDQIECVLLDLTMPKMDGYSTFSAMRVLKPSLKIILSSGFNQQEVTQRFAGKGLTGFIQKPFQFTELSQIITKIFNSHQ